MNKKIESPTRASNDRPGRPIVKEEGSTSAPEDQRWGKKIDCKVRQIDCSTKRIDCKTEQTVYTAGHFDCTSNFAFAALD